MNNNNNLYHFNIQQNKIKKIINNKTMNNYILDYTLTPFNCSLLVFKIYYSENQLNLSILPKIWYHNIEEDILLYEEINLKEKINNILKQNNYVYNEKNKFWFLNKE